MGCNIYTSTILRLFQPIVLQYSWEITGQRSLHEQKQFQLYKRGLGKASSIKSQPDPDTLEDFALAKAEKVHCFDSVGNETTHAPGQNSLKRYKQDMSLPRGIYMQPIISLLAGISYTMSYIIYIVTCTTYLYAMCIYIYNYY